MNHTDPMNQMNETKEAKYVTVPVEPTEEWAEALGKQTPMGWCRATFEANRPGRRLALAAA